MRPWLSVRGETGRCREREAIRPALPRARLGRQAGRRRSSRSRRTGSSRSAGSRRADAAARAARRTSDRHRGRPRHGRRARRRSCRPTSRSSEADFLDVDLAPIVAGGPLRVAGNLPYNISSPILFRLIDLWRRSSRPDRRRRRRVQRATAPWTDATLMLQREVAERIAAGPGRATTACCPSSFSCMPTSGGC